MQIEAANMADIPALRELVNRAYRGDTARMGWTHEADIIGGLRVDTLALTTMMQESGAAIYKCIDDNGKLLGCVYTRTNPDHLYLGMLTVEPGLQGLGIGKKLLQYAELIAQISEVDTIRMTVVEGRTELIDWYSRHGYRMTGEILPWNDREHIGDPLRPVRFLTLEKKV